MNNCCNDIFDYWGHCPSIDLTGYVTEDELEKAISGISGSSYDDSEIRSDLSDVSASLSAHLVNDDMHTTQAEKEAWNAKLDATAYTPTDLSNYYNKAQVDNALSEKQGILDSYVVLVNTGATNNGRAMFVASYENGEDKSKTISFPTINGTPILGSTTNFTLATSSQITDLYTYINEKTRKLQEKIDNCCSGGDTGDTPTPDTGSTNYKASIQLTGGTEITIDCDDSDYLTEEETHGSDTTYMQYQVVNIGDCVSEIGNRAFQRCFNMTHVTVNANVQVIHNYAFATTHTEMEVKHLDIYMNPTTPPTLVDDNAGGDYYFPTDCTIYVPSSSVDAYKTAWPTYADEIQAMTV